MTFHLVALVGAFSVVTEIWQEPPPWTAVVPRSHESCWVEPTGQLFAGVVSGGMPWQGKLEPSAASGDLLGLPNGTGLAMMAWACAVMGAIASMAAKTVVVEQIMLRRPATEQVIWCVCVIESRLKFDLSQRGLLFVSMCV
jgi:hypothetical protein